MNQGMDKKDFLNSPLSTFLTPVFNIYSQVRHPITGNES